MNYRYRRIPMAGNFRDVPYSCVPFTHFTLSVSPLSSLFLLFFLGICPVSSCVYLVLLWLFRLLLFFGFLVWGLV